MERLPYLAALDEYFAAQYSDYVRISAIEGYEAPDMLIIGKDGNVLTRDREAMRLCYQRNCAQLLERFKQSIADTDFTFSFSFPTLGERIRGKFDKNAFHKLLPAALERCGETAESAGEKLDVEPRFWKRIVKGSLLPEKNLVLALALVTHMQRQDAANLLAVCGFGHDPANVRDVVTAYLLEQRVFNAELRDACLAEYRITNLPIKR